VFLTTVVFGVC